MKFAKYNLVVGNRYFQIEMLDEWLRALALTVLELDSSVLQGQSNMRVRIGIKWCRRCVELNFWFEMTSL